MLRFGYTFFVNNRQNWQLEHVLNLQVIEQVNQAIKRVEAYYILISETIKFT